MFLIWQKQFKPYFYSIFGEKMEKRYIICSIYMPLHEFKDYYTENVGEIFRKTNFIPLVAYFQEKDRKVYFYFIKEVKSEISTKEIEELLDALNKSLKKNNAYITPPIIELLKDGLFSKKDLELMNKQIVSAYKKGTIRLIRNNIERILEDKPILDYYLFLGRIFEMF